MGSTNVRYSSNVPERINDKQGINQLESEGQDRKAGEIRDVSKGNPGEKTADTTYLNVPVILWVWRREGQKITSRSRGPLRLPICKR
ncbi:hypothetical protein GX48_06233 [Paracoccidioides brasiliensis]|nr:hypothetical protein GX48_06233 [Paracoccidioides brasiliensis]